MRTEPFGPWPAPTRYGQTWRRNPEHNENEARIRIRTYVQFSALAHIAVGNAIQTKPHFHAKFRTGSLNTCPISFGGNALCPRLTIS